MGRELDQRRATFECLDLATQRSEARGEEAAAGADLDDRVARCDIARLQDPSVDLRGEHRLALGERNRCVGEGEFAVGGGHEALARHARQRIQHARVEHVPGAHLLVDHLLAGGFDVHARIDLGSCAGGNEGAEVTDLHTARQGASGAPKPPLW